MKTEKEIQDAAVAFDWCVNSPQFTRLGQRTESSIFGAWAMLNWLLGQEKPGGVIDNTLQKIATMRRLDQ